MYRQVSECMRIHVKGDKNTCLFLNGCLFMSLRSFAYSNISKIYMFLAENSVIFSPFSDMRSCVVTKNLPTFFFFFPQIYLFRVLKYVQILEFE